MAADSRAAILAQIRAGLGVGAEDDRRRLAVQERLARHPRGTIPARVGREEDWLPLFIEKLQYQGADVTLAADGAAAVEAIAGYLRDLNLPARLRMGNDALLVALPWHEAPQLELLRGAAEASDMAGLSRAFGGAAETGTLFLVSGQANPTTLNFLPETHTVVIMNADIAGAYETVWGRLREAYGPGVLPRSVNLISGPSRTADIEQTIIKGAHGPKRLHVVVLDAVAAV